MREQSIAHSLQPTNQVTSELRRRSLVHLLAVGREDRREEQPKLICQRCAQQLFLFQQGMRVALHRKLVVQLDIVKRLARTWDVRVGLLDADELCTSPMARVSIIDAEHLLNWTRATEQRHWVELATSADDGAKHPSANRSRNL